MVDTAKYGRIFRPAVILPVGAVLAFAGVAAISLYGALSAIIDGLVVAVIVVPSAASGIVLIRLLMPQDVPVRLTVLLGAAFGLGALSALVVILGCAGMLHRSVWMAILLALMFVGFVGVRRMTVGRSALRDAGLASNAQSRPWLMGLLLVLVPFAAMAVLAAEHPPGLLWAEEGYGYDELEYHLQMPSEYRAAGQIEYAPHNVYANFPANAEMLYLLSMIVLDADVEAGTTAHLMHMVFGVLFVLAAWAVGRQWSHEAGIVCGLVAGSMGWLTYLSALAYVEHLMLLFGMAATGALLYGMADSVDRAVGMRLTLIGGLLAGFACGCKYTAVPMIAAPLALFPLFKMRVAWSRRIGGVAVFGVGCAVAFSPWLIKNTVMTGNPVFPLANGLFEAYPPGWTQQSQQQWDAGHAVHDSDLAAVSASERSAGLRKAMVLWDRIVTDEDQRLGPVLLALGWFGLIGRRRSRVDAALAMMFLAQLLVWVFATHLFARFAVVLAIPLVLLCGRSLPGSASRWRVPVVLCVVLIGAGWNLAHAVQRYRLEAVGPVPAEVMYGEPAAQNPTSVVGYINSRLADDARVLLVAEARPFYFQRDVDYTVVFNEHELARVAGKSDQAGEVVAWMLDRGYTHVIVNWSEMARLRKTYGFPDEISGSLFADLQGSGLRVVQTFSQSDGGMPFATLYGVDD